MSTFTDRSGSAVLVVDVQRGVVDGALARDEVVGRIGDLAERAREGGAPVIWVQHSAPDMPRDSDGWQIVPELAGGPAAGEPVVHKLYGDSFEDTDLGDLLAARGVGRLIVCGAQSDACVLATCYGAFVRGYDVTLVSDAHTTVDLTEWGMVRPEESVQAINLIWQFRTAPGRRAEVVPAAEVAFA